MKQYLIIVTLLFVAIQTGLACEVCKEDQPKGLEEITHGTGPRAVTDYIISWSAVIIVGVSLILSLKYIIRPQETHSTHIKHIVLNQEFKNHE